jgi:proteasome lid subunit RPN8/RPN11
VDELNHPPPADLELSQDQWLKMRAEVERCLPEEACGLILGKPGLARHVIPTTNILHSPVRYRMDPKEQLAALRRMDQEGLDLIAIYHSHPNGPEIPSPADIAEAYYPESLYLICSRPDGEWRCRGFWLRGGQHQEARIFINPGE